MSLLGYSSQETLSDTSTEPDPTQNVDPNAKNGWARNNSKHKRSLCRNFTENGYCPYGNKCQFAHGLQELKINKTHNTLYKTKVCYAYEKKVYCMYGKRCNFIHKNSENQLEKMETGLISDYRSLVYGNRNGGESRLIKLLERDH